MIHRCWCGVDRLVAVCCMMLLTGCGGFGGTALLEKPFGGEQALRNPLRGVKPEAKQDSAAASQAEMAQGRSLEQAGKYDQARKVYERLISDHPLQHKPYHRLAIVADRQRRHREAQALYTEAIRLSGGDPQLFNDIGYCLYLQGKLVKAESALLKAVALAPADARFRNNLGLVLGHLGRADEAFEQFRHGGSEADAHYNLAFIWAARDRSDEATRSFELALAADPAHEPARRALESFQHYEADPEGLDDWPVEDGDTRWVAYVEGDQRPTASEVKPATHNAEVSPSTRAPSTRPDTQALLRRARTLMSNRVTAQQE